MSNSAFLSPPPWLPCPLPFGPGQSPTPRHGFCLLLTQQVLLLVKLSASENWATGYVEQPVAVFAVRAVYAG